MKRHVLAMTVVAGLLCTAVTASAADAATAPGSPGSPSYFDLARKDCVGTARNTTSRVWFTVADGVLSDVYWPNVDATNVHTLQYVVTDGSTFTDLQTRDMTYSVSADPTGTACTVTAQDKAHGYRLTTVYATDTRRDTVLMHTTPAAPPGTRENAGGNTGTVDASGTPDVTSALTQTEAADRERRAHPARLGQNPDSVFCRRRRARRGDRGGHPARRARIGRRKFHAGPRLRPHRGPGRRHRARLAEASLPGRRGAVPGRLGGV